MTVAWLPPISTTWHYYVTPHQFGEPYYMHECAPPKAPLHVIESVWDPYSPEVALFNLRVVTEVTVAVTVVVTVTLILSVRACIKFWQTLQLEDFKFH